MARPGPKPPALEELKQLAAIFTRVFLCLRDGREGQIFRMKRVPETRLQDGRVIPLRRYRVLGGRDDGNIFDSGGDVIATIVPVKARATGRKEQSMFEASVRKQLSTITNDPVFEAKRIWIEQPIFARPDLWEKWKNADSPEEMEQIAAEIARWIRPYTQARWRRELRLHAAELFRAKEDLWNYPRSDRPTSENRRVDFFAKAIAGLMLDISPATAMRKMLGWSPLKPLPPVQPPIRAQGPKCPYCDAPAVEGYPSGTVVRCPSCDQRYFIARKKGRSQHRVRR